MPLPIEPYPEYLLAYIHSRGLYQARNLPVISKTANAWADTLSTCRGTNSKSTHAAINSSIWRWAVQ